MQIIDQQYNQPTGALLLAFDGNAAIGCAGVRRHDEATAELKRMYVQDGTIRSKAPSIWKSSYKLL